MVLRIHLFGHNLHQTCIYFGLLTCIAYDRKDTKLELANFMSSSISKHIAASLSNWDSSLALWFAISSSFPNPMLRRVCSAPGLLIIVFPAYLDWSLFIALYVVCQIKNLCKSLSSNAAMIISCAHSDLFFFLSKFNKASISSLLLTAAFSIGAHSWESSFADLLTRISSTRTGL